MEIIVYNSVNYISPNAEVYNAKVDGVLCVSYTVEIVNGGVITEDEDPWETKQ